MNGSFVTSSYAGVRSLTFNWWLNSQDINGNYSDIGWNFVGSGSNNGKWYYILNGYLNINGARVFTQGGNKIQLAFGTVLASGTTRIYHNSDGTKTFSADGGGTIYWYETWQTGSGSWGLPTIPRASSGSGGSGNIGATTTIYINRASAGFVHTLTYTFGSLSGTIATNVGTSVNWVIPVSFYTQIPTSNTGTGTITCYTYSNGVHIGTSSWQFTANVVNSNPVFGDNPITYLDSDSNTVKITENNQHIVRYNSNLKVTFEGATPQNSASISDYEITFNGNVQHRNAPTTIDYGKINSSQNLVITVKAIDSRGNSSTVNKEIIIFDWVLPSAIVTVKRVNNYEDATKIKVQATISNVNSKNEIVSIQYRYKKSNTADYSEYVNISNNVESSIVIDKLYAWNFQFVIKDKFGTTTYNLIVSKGIPIMFIDTLMQAIGVNCFPTTNNGFFVSDLNLANLLPVGSTKITTDNVNPEKYLGGSWDLVANGNLFGPNHMFYLWERVG